MKFNIKKYTAAVKDTLSKAMQALAVYFGDEKYTWNNKTTNRRLLLLLGCMFFFDYLLFCWHSDKNVFNIIPPIPVLSSQEEITVYLPEPAGGIIEEKRLAYKYENKENFVGFLFNTVVKGSLYQNTALAVPVKLTVRRVWLPEEEPGLCAIDCELTELNAALPPEAGTQENFVKALEQTVTANLPEIKQVMLLAGGVPNGRLW